MHVPWHFEVSVDLAQHTDHTVLVYVETGLPIPSSIRRDVTNRLALIFYFASCEMKCIDS